MRLHLILFLTIAIAGCSAQPDRALKNDGINLALIDAPIVTIHPVSINGAHPPDGTLETALNRIRPFLRSTVQIAPMATLRLASTVPAPLILRNSNIKPSSSEIIIAYVPDLPTIGRGLYTRLSDGYQQIVFNAAGVHAMKGLFLSENDAWTLVQTHELGHALGVPATANHTWQDGHCTNPRCVMYPRSDWRSVLAAAFALGPPHDFCDQCRAELQAAKNRRTPSTTRQLR